MCPEGYIDSSCSVEVMCQYWDTDAGAMKSDGVSRVGTTRPTPGSGGSITCATTHLTNFGGVLVIPTTVEELIKELESAIRFNTFTLDEIAAALNAFWDVGSNPEVWIAVIGMIIADLVSLLYLGAFRGHRAQLKRKRSGNLTSQEQEAERLKELELKVKKAELHQKAKNELLRVASGASEEVSKITSSGCRSMQRSSSSVKEFLKQRSSSSGMQRFRITLSSGSSRDHLKAVGMESHRRLPSFRIRQDRVLPPVKCDSKVVGGANGQDVTSIVSMQQDHGPVKDPRTLPRPPPPPPEPPLPTQPPPPPPVPMQPPLPPPGTTPALQSNANTEAIEATAKLPSANVPTPEDSESSTSTNSALTGSAEHRKPLRLAPGFSVSGYGVSRAGTPITFRRPPPRLTSNISHRSCFFPAVPAPPPPCGTVQHAFRPYHLPPVTYRSYRIAPILASSCPSRARTAPILHPTHPIRAASTLGPSAALEDLQLEMHQITAEITRLENEKHSPTSPPPSPPNDIATDLHAGDFSGIVPDGVKHIKRGVSRLSVKMKPNSLVAANRSAGAPKRWSQISAVDGARSRSDVSSEVSSATAENKPGVFDDRLTLGRVRAHARQAVWKPKSGRLAKLERKQSSSSTLRRQTSAEFLDGMFLDGMRERRKRREDLDALRRRRRQLRAEAGHEPAPVWKLFRRIQDISKKLRQNLAENARNELTFVNIIVGANNQADNAITQPQTIQMFYNILAVELFFILAQHSPSGDVGGGGRRGKGGGPPAADVTLMSAFSAISPISAVISGIFATLAVMPVAWMLTTAFKHGNSRRIKKSGDLGRVVKLAKRILHFVHMLCCWWDYNGAVTRSLRDGSRSAALGVRDRSRSASASLNNRGRSSVNAARAKLSRMQSKDIPSSRSNSLLSRMGSQSSLSARGTTTDWLTLQRQAALKHEKTTLRWRTDRTYYFRLALAWTLAAVVYLLSLFLVLLYSAAYGRKDSASVLLSWITSLGCSFAIIEPVQVVILSTLPFLFDDQTRLGRCLERGRWFYLEFLSP